MSGQMAPFSLKFLSRPPKTGKNIDHLNVKLKFRPLVHKPCAALARLAGAWLCTGGCPVALADDKKRQSRGLSTATLMTRRRFRPFVMQGLRDEILAHWTNCVMLRHLHYIPQVWRVDPGSICRKVAHISDAHFLICPTSWFDNVWGSISSRITVFNAGTTHART